MGVREREKQRERERVSRVRMRVRESERERERFEFLFPFFSILKKFVPFGFEENFAKSAKRLFYCACLDL